MRILILSLIWVILLSATSGAVDTQQRAPLKQQVNHDQPIELLVQKMTLDEKIGQLIQYSYGSELTGPGGVKLDILDEIRRGRVGSLLNLTGAGATKEIQQIAVNQSRLGIPLIFGYDVIHGFKTIFPVPLGEAASWDLQSIQRSARIAAIEASAAGLHWTFAPMVDIARDPRWGRIMEGAGEDPYLGSLIAAARVHGFQGENLSADTTLLACVKHYAAYGAALGGRDYNTVDISDRTLREVYLPPFHAAVKAGVGSLMSSFNEINGIPATGNKYFLTDILRGEWGFDGFIVSDWGSIQEMIPHGIVHNKYEASELALQAGVDMDMMSSAYIENLAKLVQDKRLSEKQIDAAVYRILKMKFELGLFDDPYRYCNTGREKKMILNPRHLDAARDMARKSMVLLKNDKNLLPLSRKIGSIAVIGPLADNKEDPLGTWAAQGEAKDVITLLQGIKAALPSKTKVLYSRGCQIDKAEGNEIQEAVELAKTTDVIIAAVGESAMMTGEGLSRADIRIPEVQIDLLKALVETGKPVVVVLMNGRPLILRWVSENVPAIVETWLAGTQAGHAIADVLFGDYNPSGKLPVSFPYAVGQIPVFYNHKNTGRPKVENQRFCSRYTDIPNEPLYPFGYGLSYTTFAYSEITFNKDQMVMSDTLAVNVAVTNTGKVKGEEVVQIYIQDLVGSVTRPVKELKGFQKIMLSPGEQKNIRFKLTATDLAFYDREMKWVAEPGEFKVYVGGSSVDVKEARFELK